jgi:hypothetical protein
VIAYGLGAVCAFFAPYLSFAIYALVAFSWLIPNRRFERLLHSEGA